MPKVLQRLLVFFIGIPVVIAIILPKFCYHLPLHLLIITFSFLASLELSNMLSKKGKTFPKAITTVLSISLPVVTYLCIYFKLDYVLVELTLALNVLLIFAIEIFANKEFSDSNTKIANAIFTIVYSGFLPTFISRLTRFNHSVEVICLFVMLVFISDSAAWFFGMLFGKNNRGIVSASPNKSIAGFIGAFIGSILIAVLLKFVFWKDIFGSNGLVRLIILAICVTITSIIGDLAESVFKRSSECKDSGNIILGRGGALDSIDSILASAPFYYIILKYIFDLTEKF